MLESKTMKLPDNAIELDGAAGEGGGQILRSALTLSMITGIAFHVKQIRAGRPKPGLLRQHLTAVNAAAAICGAHISGAELGSRSLVFIPGQLKAGDYRFAIGSAGSTTLVLQTLIPALWFAPGASQVHVSGGTHNSAAPPVDFLQRCWLPLLQRMGAHISIDLLRHGFMPAGGGEVLANVEALAGPLQGLTLDQRGALQQLRATAIVAGVSRDVAERELAQLQQRLGDLAGEVRQLPTSHGPGNVLLLEAQSENVTEQIIAFGERSRSAEAVANNAASDMQTYLDSPCAVGEHLADQLLLPLALAGSGSFTTHVLSSHLQTNIEVIQKFLPVEFETAEVQGGWRVVVRG